MWSCLHLCTSQLPLGAPSHPYLASVPIHSISSVPHTSHLSPCTGSHPYLCTPCPHADGVLYLTSVPHICTYVNLTPVPHTCTSYVDLIYGHHTCTSYMYLIHVPHICTSHVYLTYLYITPVPHIFVPHTCTSHICTSAPNAPHVYLCAACQLYLFTPRPCVCRGGAV